MQPFLISIHALREEGDAVSGWATRLLLNFNPRPPRGGRRISLLICARRSKFQSTPSARRATPETGCGSTTLLHFNPRPPRGGRRRAEDDRLYLEYISIHALREEGDAVCCPCPLRRLSISIHALREEGDLGCRRKTAVRSISIHALREEGDPITKPCSSKDLVFQSTPSARRATCCRVLHVLVTEISIHALREEGDGTRKQQCTGLKSFQSTPSARRATSSDTKQFCSVRNFNPRPPRGGRRVYNHIENTAAIFQSTPSARRATPENPVRTEEIIISIHALREEGDAALPT